MSTEEVKIIIEYCKEDVEEMLGVKLTADEWETLADRVERKADTWEIIKYCAEAYYY